MGTCNISTQNGGDLQAQAIFDDAVLYPSPYMVVTPKGYTNHYYAGSERIASRIGDRCWTITATDDWEKPAPETEAREAFWNIGKENPFGTMSDYSSTTINTTFDAGYIDKVQYQCAAIELPSVDILYGTNMLEATIDCDVSYQNSAPIYYYHPDHLGSTSWVTDETGTEQQFLAYLPYGEPLMDVHLKTYDGRHGPDDIRYKFTGKERDAETGYDYMEQRYYYPPLSIWLRPDPLLDKYIHLSPYVYCNGNPLKYVDPDGRLPISNLIIGYYAMAMAFEKSSGNSDIRTAGYAMQYPINALIVGRYHDYSNNITSITGHFVINLMDAIGLSYKEPGDEGNAYRHALWQALLINIFGKNHAQRIGNAHENNSSIDTRTTFNNKDDADTAVDLRNNIIGRRIGARNKGANNKKLAQLVLKEYYENGLWGVTPQTDGSYTIEKKFLTKGQYVSALKELNKLDNNGKMKSTE